MASIKRPGVEVTQENVTAQATVSAPDLTSVIVGPCKQIVDAFNDSGVAQSEALAGTYQDGKGTIAYPMPSIKAGAVVETSSVRVFRVDGAGASSELRSSTNETTITTGTSGVYNGTTTFTAASATFTADGVTKGDFVRVTYRGEVVDLEITAAVGSATTLTVANSISQTDPITFSTFSIVRNPAQFVFKSAAEQADAEIGDVTDPETNYLHVAIKSTAATALVGAAGDSFKLQLKESTPDYSIAYAATGTAFATGTGIGTQFSTLNGSFGPSSVTTLADDGYALIYKAGASPIGQSDALAVAALGSGDADTIVLSGATTLGGSPQGCVGKLGADPETGNVLVYDHTGNGAGERVVVFQSAHGIASATNAFVFIETGSGGSGTGGLYPVDAVVSPTVLQLGSGGSDNPGGDVTNGTSGAQLFGLTLTGSSVVALTSGGLDKVYDYSTASTLETALGTSPSGKSIVFGSDALASAAYQPISSVSGRVATLSAALSSPAAGTAVTNGASGKQAQAVETTASTAFIEPTGSSKTYQIVLPRVAGESTRSIADLVSDLDGDSTFSANFDATAAGSGTFTYAEAVTVDFDGGVDANNILVDADLIGSTTATHNIYVSYKALRVDVSDQASSPALVEISSTTDVTTKLGKISADNPLALAAYLAALQSPSTTFKCLGVSATSVAEPSGTTAAYTSALSFLEGQDVYAVACLSQDPAIQALFSAHVTAMSAAANKSERIAFVSQAMPSYSTATLLSSGTAGNTGSGFGSDYLFTTDVDFALNSALTTVLADTATDDLILVVTARSSVTGAPTAANGVLPIKYGVRVDKSATSSYHSATDSTALKLKASEVSSALSLDATWASQVDVTWALYKMGTALATTAAKATAVAGLGAQFANKRVFLVWPDTASASISGSAVSMGGEYLAAAWAAKVGFEAPSAPFTNRTLTGFSSLTNSNGLFSKSQLDEIAGGGTYITVQDSPSAALSCRHQLSTKVDTIQNRELSITKTVDYVAKQLRQVLEPKIGSFLITQSYLDSLGVIVDGVLTNFIENGTLVSGKVNFIEVDSTSSDTVNIQVIISVPFPANYIALTLQF